MKLHLPHLKAMKRVWIKSVGFDIQVCKIGRKYWGKKDVNISFPVFLTSIPLLLERLNRIK